MEIYGRELRDLLAPSSKERPGAKLRIRNGKQGTYVQGVRRMAVASYAEIEKVQEVGNSNRTVGATLMNAHPNPNPHPHPHPHPNPSPNPSPHQARATPSWAMARTRGSCPS